jgi:pyruvate,water dikinase
MIVSKDTNMTTYIKLLRELDRTDLPVAGGKGANLGALTRAGLPVPPGFCISTAAYRSFVKTNELDLELKRILDATQMDDPVALDAAADAIRASFEEGQMTRDMIVEIRQAYAGLGAAPVPVAVRSSATAEDLPDLSFAGQQDTYLNILGADSLLQAVVRCWASLWTARAIAYRARNAIAHDDVSLAVVVQQMVPSEASGVLFTANPLTGKRSETVIDATLGLGEALVSGQVEPDHYVVSSASGEILSRSLGAKALSIQGQPGGGTITLHNSAAKQQALPDEQISALTQLGQQAQAHFGSPQDLEWGWAGGRLYVLQSRPITSLYPLPAGMQDEPREVLLSFGVWQGMLDPYTAIGQDVFSCLVSGIGGVLGAQIGPQEQRVFLPAGERLFVNLTGLLGNPTGRALAKTFLTAIDPVSAEILEALPQAPNPASEKSFKLADQLKLARGVAPLIGNVLFNLLWPERGLARLDANIRAQLAEIQSECQSAPSLPALIEIIETLDMPARMMPRLVGGIAAGQAPYQILLRQAEAIPGGTELLMGLARGLPNNVTTQMDLDLWQTSQAIRANPAAAEHFNITEVEDLVAEYQAGQLPNAAQNAIEHFLAHYGMRGIAEIDLGRARWREQPASVFQSLKSYLHIAVAASPQAIFERGAEHATVAQAQLIAAFRQKPGGIFKAWLVRFATRRFRALGGLRETPKFFVVRLLGHFRSALLVAGQKLVAEGRLNASEDVFYLHLWELKALGSGEIRDWQTLVSERRANYARELRRKRVPRIMLSDGTAFYDAPHSAAADDPNALTGSPVSAGVVEGMVRVVLNPHGAQLVPGEILVCPATDPAWTPLFLSAGGLVMEVGGMMTHGSVVAREYGIPAVVGVREVTTRLQTGQRVRVDGSSGVITILV